MIIIIIIIIIILTEQQKLEPSIKINVKGLILKYLYWIEPALDGADCRVLILVVLNVVLQKQNINADQKERFLAETNNVMGYSQ